MEETPEQRRERIRSQMGLNSLAFDLAKIEGRSFDYHVNPAGTGFSSRRVENGLRVSCTKTSGRKYEIPKG